MVPHFLKAELREGIFKTGKVAKVAFAEENMKDWPPKKGSELIVWTTFCNKKEKKYETALGTVIGIEEIVEPRPRGEGTKRMLIVEFEITKTPSNWGTTSDQLDAAYGQSKAGTAKHFLAMNARKNSHTISRVPSGDVGEALKELFN